MLYSFFFFFNDTATTEIYTLSLHDALPIWLVDELVHPAIVRDITLAAAQRMTGGWRPKRKRPGGFVGGLLDGNPLGRRLVFRGARRRSEEHTSELQSRLHLVCRLLLEKKKNKQTSAKP